MGIDAELVQHDFPTAKLKVAAGIILSGGPQNLSENTSLKADKKIFALGVPVLGICYGMQLMAHMLGGKVKSGKSGEYGPAKIQLNPDSDLFLSLYNEQEVWMSHGDSVRTLPKGFSDIASTPDCPHAAMEDSIRKLYGIQFHAEVDHTPHGRTVLKNFARTCGLLPSSANKNNIKHMVQLIRNQVGKDKALCAFSGGIDSVVAATLVSKAIGKQLTCIYVDTGLMREGETELLRKNYSNIFNLKIIRAEKEFLTALKGLTDPESKRKTIGHTFIKIFEREAKKLKGIKWLVQGTLYTDAISSGRGRGKATAVIKSHHNVGGLPEKLGFKLLEPLRDMYKFEVRLLAAQLRLPAATVHKQPFPGPGLGVRVIGEVTKDKLEIVRRADKIVEEEVVAAQLTKMISQYFAILSNTKTVGVKGDGRSYGQMIGIRAIYTTDYLTLSVPEIPYSVLRKIVSRITNEIKEVTRVVYDITPKPPGTVEWE